MDTDIVVLVSDKNLWALKPFLYLFDRYWGARERLVIAGFTDPGDLGVTFYSLGPQANFPAKNWSDALLVLLESKIISDRFVLMLEDYWLCRQVDRRALDLLGEYAWAHDDILRLDLTTDRLYSDGLTELGPLEHLDLIEADVRQPYSVSLQAGIWNRKLLQKFIVRGESPWEFEINGSGRLGDRKGMRVIGTRQGPVRYVIGIRQGVASLDGNWQGPPRQFIREDREALEAMIP